MTTRGTWPDGEFLRSARLALNLTQAQLAHLADLDVKTVRKAEKGERLDLSTIQRLAGAVDADVARLLQGGRREKEHLHRATIRRWEFAVRRADWDGVTALYHDTAVLRLPGEPLLVQQGIFSGRTEISTAYRSVLDLIVPQVNSSLKDVLISEDELAVLRTHRVLPGAKRRSECIPLVHTFSFLEGLISEHVVLFDALRLAWSRKLVMPRRTRPRR